jgi:hypothetical protein
MLHFIQKKKKKKKTRRKKTNNNSNKERDKDYNILHFLLLILRLFTTNRAALWITRVILSLRLALHSIYCVLRSLASSSA